MTEIPHLLRRTHYAMRQVIDSALADYNLTASQYEIMSKLGECNCLEHRELLDALDVASPTLTKLVNHLEGAGYIEREKSTQDARVKLIALTENGRSLCETIQEKYPEFIKQLLHDFSPAEHMLLAELLERLASNAEAIDLV